MSFAQILSREKSVENGRCSNLHFKVTHFYSELHRQRIAVRGPSVVVVKWSTCSPATLTVRVCIPLKPTVYSEQFVFEKNVNKSKKPRVEPFLKKNWS